MPDDRALIDLLQPLVTPERRARIDEVIAHRHYGLTVVLDRLHDDGNLSAVLRTCDGLGIQRVNVLLSDQLMFKSARTVSLGSHKWLDLHNYTSPQVCARELRDAGYSLVATHLEASVPLEEIDFSRPIALILGNEHSGVSQDLVAACDQRVRIPMYGFVQSFNIASAAAMSLYYGMSRRRALTQLDSDLTPQQADALRARFYRRTLKSSDLMIKAAFPHDAL